MDDLVLERRSFDNKYLHKDFHASIDNAVAYIGDNFGKEAVIEYLRRYVEIRYPVFTLSKLNDYFISIYNDEEYSEYLHTELSEHSLHIIIYKSPGYEYLNNYGGPSKWYRYTDEYLYAFLAEKCGLRFKLNYYNSVNGNIDMTFSE